MTLRWTSPPHTVNPEVRQFLPGLRTFELADEGLGYPKGPRQLGAGGRGRTTSDQSFASGSEAVRVIGARAEVECRAEPRDICHIEYVIELTTGRTGRAAG